MNLNKLIVGMMLLFSIAVFSISCGGSTTSEVKMEEVDKSGPEYTSAYVCPMHCDGSGSASEGKCPVCGMAYVENREDHSGHDHDSHEGHNH